MHRRRSFPSPGVDRKGREILPISLRVQKGKEILPTSWRGQKEEVDAAYLLACSGGGGRYCPCPGVYSRGRRSCPLPGVDRRKRFIARCFPDMGHRIVLCFKLWKCNVIIIFAIIGLSEDQIVGYVIPSSDVIIYSRFGWWFRFYRGHVQHD